MFDRKQANESFCLEKRQTLKAFSLVIHITRNSVPLRLKKFVCTCSSVEVKVRILHTIYIFNILFSGDNLIVGSYDRRLCWFDMDLSTKPYKTLRLVMQRVCLR